ncbi:MAG: cellulase family glycosylhydrolase [Deltaproteobacteria bacterium]|nr:cellulase family glycosylhydrolase [Deltaproteobacteria bacterium]
MRRLFVAAAFAAAFAALAGACAGPGDDEESGVYFPPDAAPDVETFPGTCAPLPPIAGFVQKQGAALWVQGRPFRVGGTNAYYLQQLFANAELGERDSESVALQALDTMVCLRLPVARLWAFNEARDRSAIRTGPDQFREVGLRGLDRAVAEAKARGIRLILTLTNNWPEYGGLPAMAAWVGKSKNDFFSDRSFQALWRQYVALLSSRVNVYTGVAYKDEPTIMAWELGNEFRCESCVGTSALTDTVARLSRFAKTMFPNHLIADGGEGFDDTPNLYRGLSNTYAVSGGMGASFHRLAAIPSLDLLSSHFYPRSWGLTSSGDAAVWIARHDSIARANDKVAYLGEYGLAGQGDVVTDDVRAVVYDAWLERLFASTGGTLGFFWQLVPAGRPNGDGHGVHSDRDGLTVGVVQKWLGAAAPP